VANLAIVEMGGPRQVLNQPFDKGTSKRAGLSPRQSNQQYSTMLQPGIQS